MNSNVQAAYDQWAGQYDTNENKTRDLEKIALRELLSGIRFNRCLEIGCGTGKNTEWLVTRAEAVLGVDLSPEMLAKARSKIRSERAEFTLGDINQPWVFAENRTFDLATFSLVLEHIENLEPVFEQLSRVVSAGGFVYVGELHPFKQYLGSKARFETEEGLQVVTCFNHHLSDFTLAAGRFGFSVDRIEEYFDQDDRTGIPRILAILFRKND